MTNRKVLKELERIMKEDGLLSSKAYLTDWLDYLGVIGVEEDTEEPLIDKYVQTMNFVKGGR